MIGRSVGARSTRRRAPRTRAARGAPRAHGAEPGGRDLPLEPRGDLGGRALRLALSSSRTATRAAPLGRPGADPRPRLGDRRLGALGQRLVPAHRRARLRRGRQRAAAAFFPLYPLRSSACSDASSAATTSSPGSSSRSPARSRAFVLLYRLAEDAPRRRRRAPRGALPGGLPDGALPRRRLQRVPLPPARDRRVPARRARPLRSAPGSSRGSRS